MIDQTTSEVEPLYELSTTCPACGHSFRTSRIRPRFKKAIRVDSDFCPHYSNPDLNPDYYVVQVCEKCGCGTTEHASKHWSEQQTKLFKETVAAQWKPHAYGGARSWQEALETYQLALITSQAIKESQRIVAGLLHHIAWLYRYKENVEQEQKYLKFALNAYLAVYERESIELNDTKLIYVTGEIHRRLGEYGDAAKCFAKIIHDKRVMDAAIIRSAREQWAVMREEMQRLQLETPDQLFEESKIKLT